MRVSGRNRRVWQKTPQIGAVRPPRTGSPEIGAYSRGKTRNPRFPAPLCRSSRDRRRFGSHRERPEIDASRCADLGVHPRRPETHRDLRACTSELHRSREALSRARGRAPIWGRPRRPTETAPISGHTCWNPPIWGVAPIWGHSSESAPIWEKSLNIIATASMLGLWPVYVYMNV